MKLMLWLHSSKKIGVDAQVDTELPRSLAEIVGNTYTFQLKLKDFNLLQSTKPSPFLAFFLRESLHLCHPLLWMLVSFLNVNLLLSVYNLCVCYLINRKVCRSLKHRSLKLWQRDLMSKLITLALLQRRHLHLMVHLPDVQNQPVSKLLWKRMHRRNHVWNESTMRHNHVFSLSNNCFCIFQFPWNQFPFL